MTTTGRTRAELAAWLDRWNENGAAPSAETVADFLGIELAPEHAAPVGQRRRSPEGDEVIKTFDGTHEQLWRVYRAEELCDLWRSDVEVAGWEVITDAPEVPEDIIAAVTCLITETGESLQGSRGIARRMADAGLLVGTTPEAPKCDREHLPDGYVSVDFRAISSASLAWFVNVPSGRALLQIGDAARAELARRDES